MKNWFVVLIFFATVCTWSQTSNEKLLNGKIVADSASVVGIDVVNLGNEKVTVTNNKGEFSILVKVNDILVFSSMTLEMKRMLVDEDDLKSETITIYRTPKINELNEVIVKKNLEINALSLGIVQKKPKHYTPAERKLYTATGLDTRFGLNTSFSIDPLLNLASGKTAELIKNIEVERKQYWLGKITEMFSENLLVNKYKIPVDYIKGFQYYIIENKNFVETLKSKNTAMSSFLMLELAVKYNEMIACE
jgi:hypothetical protein